jgi:hypothetical protein
MTDATAQTRSRLIPLFLRLAMTLSPVRSRATFGEMESEAGRGRPDLA